MWRRWDNGTGFGLSCDIVDRLREFKKKGTDEAGSDPAR